jgi:anti-sigma-K factor RskA
LNHERATEDVRELAALYALGALTQHEAQSFEMHLREGCAVCETELRRFERTAARIGFAVEEAETPEYLRELLLARIEREPQEAVPSAVLDQKKDGQQPKEGIHPPPMSQSILFGSQNRSPRRFPWMLVVALAAIVALGVTVYALRSAREANNQLQSRISTFQADFDNLNLLLDSQEEKSGRLDKILAMVEGPGVRIASLVVQTAAHPSAGAIFWDTEQSQCLLFGSLPPAPPQRTYQFWFVTPSTKVSLGLVKTDPAGRVFIETSVPKEATNATLAGVTLEPTNGSPTPTTRFYAVSRFD